MQHLTNSAVYDIPLRYCFAIMLSYILDICHLLLHLNTFCLEQHYLHATPPLCILGPNYMLYR